MIGIKTQYVYYRSGSLWLACPHVQPLPLLTEEIKYITSSSDIHVHHERNDFTRKGINLGDLIHCVGTLDPILTTGIEGFCVPLHSVFLAQPVMPPADTLAVLYGFTAQ